MNVRMYENAVTQRNLDICRELGWTIVEPGSGMLACQDVGKGRMEEPPRSKWPWPICCVRTKPLKRCHYADYVCSLPPAPRRNRSTPYATSPTIPPGKMGYAIAEQARDMGADVTLVSGLCH